MNGHRLRTLAAEVVLLGGLYVVYSVTRVFAADDLGAAQDRAGDLLRIEGALGLDLESWLNQAVSGVAWLAVPMDYWYSVLHYVVTPAALVWLFVRRRHDYPRARNALVIASALGLVCYLLLPTAPPRLMDGTAYVDTLAAYAHYGWWSDHASAPAGLGHLTNELAALPSLHVGWAVWVAWALGGRLLYLYPAATALVVVATGNHWVLDGVLGALVVALGILGAGRLAAAGPATRVAARALTDAAGARRRDGGRRPAPPALQPVLTTRTREMTGTAA